MDIQSLARKVWEGDAKAPVALRKALFQAGKSFLQTFRLPEENLEEILQKHISLLISRLFRQEGEVIRSVKSYFFTCIKHEAIREAGRLGKQTPIDDSDSMEEELISENPEDILARKEDLSININRLKAAIQHLGTGCREVIDLCFYQQYSHPEVARLMGYTTTNTAKTRKSQCLDRLRQLFFNHPNRPSTDQA